MFHAQALELLNRIHRSLGPISVRPELGWLYC